MRNTRNILERPKSEFLWSLSVHSKIAETLHRQLACYPFTNHFFSLKLNQWIKGCISNKQQQMDCSDCSHGRCQFCLNVLFITLMLSFFTILSPSSSSKKPELKLSNGPSYQRSSPGWTVRGRRWEWWESWGWWPGRPGPHSNSGTRQTGQSRQDLSTQSNSVQTGKN